MFQGWGRRSLEKLSYFFRNGYYTNHQIVYREMDKPSELFIIKSGEFRLFKEIKDGNRKPKIMEIAILTEGEIFGEEDVLANKPRRFSAKCVSPKGELLVMP